MEKPACSKPVMDHREEFRQRLREWFSREGKDYPWRRTRDPYAVLVSEVMLQQTRLAMVLGRGYFTRFMEAFPDVHALAAAGDGELLKAWEGLGYYRRVRMLRGTAQAVVRDHGGTFPSGLDELLRLPGIGRYTAGALRAFAFGLPAVVVDGNVTRVIVRLMDERGAWYSAAGMAAVWEWAAGLADDEEPRAYHSALMELGQTHCRVGVPDCARCPVSSFCATPVPALVPAKKVRPKPEEVTEEAVWFRDRSGRVLLHREAGSRRTGLWKLPLRTADDFESHGIVSRSTYGITRYRVTLVVRDGGVVGHGSVEREGDAWVSPGELDGLAMAAPFRRVVENLLRDFGNRM